MGQLTVPLIAFFTLTVPLIAFLMGQLSNIYEFKSTQHDNIIIEAVHFIRDRFYFFENDRFVLKTTKKNRNDSFLNMIF